MFELGTWERFYDQKSLGHAGIKVKHILSNQGRMANLWPTLGWLDVLYLDRGLGYIGECICQNTAPVYLAFVNFIAFKFYIRRKDLWTDIEL